MRVCRAYYSSRDGQKRKSKRWYVELRDHLEIVRRIPAFEDKRASEEFGRRLERLISLRISGEQPDSSMVRWMEGLPATIRKRLASIGILDPQRAASTKAVREHLSDYEQSLRDSGATPEYVKKTTNRIMKILDGIDVVFLSELCASSVSRHLADRRAEGLSAKSSNHYLAAIKGFYNWLVMERRATESPIAHLSALNAQASRKHVRRALEPDELRTLLSAACNGPERDGMTGEARYWLYRLAVETGLRSNELRSLTRSSFELNGAEPCVSLPASATKNRKAATLPLRSDTARELSGFLGAKLPTAEVFRMPRPEKVVVMLRADLEAAGIPYRDSADRVVDFHALRTTFASLLLRSGVDIRTAKDLMRHSTIAMTADVYACTMRGSQHEAVKRLPDLSDPDVRELRATGTENVLPECLPEKCTDPYNPVRGDSTDIGDDAGAQSTVKTGTYGDSEGYAMQESAPHERSPKPPPRGLEPLSPG